ncbi:MAG TPA: sigma-70 family RNA polymerase sigma factor [Bryobacteraceae bacterium]|nr:sigma-70 family RNA polymerase sigma factor [Bryobacteraceae bacterium]
MTIPGGCAPAVADQGAVWMLAFRAGDTTKFALLLNKYRSPVVAYLYRLVHDHAVAEELAQEVFLRVYRAHNYEASADFRSWLIRIATNLARNWVRDHRADSATISLDDQPSHTRLITPRSPAPNIEERLISESRLYDVRKAVDALPERHRAAILMHKYLDMDYWEIARAQNCSVSAVKSMLFRAYENLRRRLAHLDPGRKNELRAAGFELRVNPARGSTLVARGS